MCRAELGTGVEWLIDAFECDENRLQDPDVIRWICEQVITDLGLKVIGQPQSYRFDQPGGVTAFYMLSESHLACHTYPEHGIATFNLYCCRARRPWDWVKQLQTHLGAGSVTTNQVSRGTRTQEDSDRQDRPAVGQPIEANG